MARRIRWQIVIALGALLAIGGLFGRLALLNASVANPLSGGRYVEAIIGAPATTIPILAEAAGDQASRDLAALIYDGLVRLGPDGLVGPALAQRYEVDPSGEVYTFFLRRDVRWHDGTPFNADDVIFTLRAIQEFEPIDPSLAAFWGSTLIDRIDDYTVRITLDRPYAPLLSLARVPMLPAHILASQPASAWPSLPFAQRPIGTGPYLVAELDAGRALLQANPSYYGGRPFIDELELRFIASSEAAEAALRRGDLTAFGARVFSLEAPASVPNQRQIAVPLDEYTTLSMNLRRAPFDQLELRRALALGLDKTALLEGALGGNVAPIDTPILPGWWAYDAEQRWYAPDQVAAQRLLSEQGYDPASDGILSRDGLRLSFQLLSDTNPLRVAAANEIARQWAELGVEVQVVQLEGRDLLERLSSRNFDLALHSWARLGPEPDPFALWHSSQTENGLNYAGLADAEIDALLESGRRENEIALRADDYRAFQARWIALVPAIALFQPYYEFSAADDLGGLGFDERMSSASLLLAGPEDRYRDVARWYLNSSREIDGSLR